MLACMVKYVISKKVINIKLKEVVIFRDGER